MFNKTVINTKQTEYVPFEKTVTEIKAPTDESIRLLNEFKTKVLEDTLLLIEVKDTQFDFVARYGVNSETLEKFAVIKFSFNGQEFTREIIVSPVKLLETREAVVTHLIDQYRNAIYECVTEELHKIKVNYLLDLWHI